MCPSLIEIGSKTAEKNSAQTNKQTNRHYKNNGHLAVNQNTSNYITIFMVHVDQPAFLLWSMLETCGKWGIRIFLQDKCSDAHPSVKALTLGKRMSWWKTKKITIMKQNKSLQTGLQDTNPTIRPYTMPPPQFRLPTEPRQCTQATEVTSRPPWNAPIRCCCTLLAASAYHSYAPGWVLAVLSAFLALVTLTFDHQNGRRPVQIVVEHACKISCPYLFPLLRNL